MPPEDPIAKLEAVAARADLSDTDGAELRGVRDAMGLMSRAADSYVTEIDTVSRDWASLPAGAADHRRRVAATALDEDLEIGFKVGRALLDDAIAKLEAKALPKPPKDPAEVRLLRDEWQLLASTGDAARLAETALKVATGPRRDLASIVFTPWFESLGVTRGGLNPKTLDGIRSAAVAATVQHGRDTEKAAATRARSLRHDGSAALTATLSAARARTDQAGNRR